MHTKTKIYAYISYYEHIFYKNIIHLLLILGEHMQEFFWKIYVYHSLCKIHVAGRKWSYYFQNLDYLKNKYI